MVDVRSMKWSFSRLNSFYSCKHAWFRSYILKERGLGNSFANYGTMVHEIFEKYAKGQLEIFELSDEFEKQFESNVWDFPPNRYVDLCESYKNQGIDYFNNFDGFDDYKILGVEKEINFEIDGYKFIGYIDSLLENKEGNLIIQDFKSKASFKSKAEKKEYARQLYLYSIPIIEEYNKYPTKLIFNMFRKQNIVEIPFDIKALEEAKEWALNTIKLISKEEKFEANINEFFCNQLCNHREICEERLIK